MTFLSQNFPTLWMLILFNLFSNFFSRRKFHNLSILNIADFSWDFSSDWLIDSWFRLWLSLKLSPVEVEGSLLLNQMWEILEPHSLHIRFHAAKIHIYMRLRCANYEKTICFQDWCTMQWRIQDVLQYSLSPKRTPLVKMRYLVLCFSVLFASICYCNAVSLYSFIHSHFYAALHGAWCQLKSLVTWYCLNVYLVKYSFLLAHCIYAID